VLFRSPLPHESRKHCRQLTAAGPPPLPRVPRKRFPAGMPSRLFRFPFRPCAYVNSRSANSESTPVSALSISFHISFRFVIHHLHTTWNRKSPHRTQESQANIRTMRKTQDAYAVATRVVRSTLNTVTYTAVSCMSWHISVNVRVHVPRFVATAHPDRAKENPLAWYTTGYTWQ
jgi:hypothetical protein